MIMALLAILLSLLAISTAGFYRHKQADRVRLVASQLAQSAVAYARAHRSAWSTTQPAEPLKLDVRPLLPPHITGTATLTFPVLNGQRICRIEAHAAWNAYASTREIDLPIP
jgi:hypothetical protein